MATKPTKHVYDHKRRVNVLKGVTPLSDHNLTPNEEALLKIIEKLAAKIEKIESSASKVKVAPGKKKVTPKNK